MDEPGDAFGYSRQVALRDGTRVRIRMARADDRQRHVTAFQGLGRQTIYRRHFSSRRGLSEADVLAVNPAMLAVFRRCDLPTTTSRDGGVVHLAMDIVAPKS